VGSRGWIKSRAQVPLAASSRGDWGLRGLGVKLSWTDLRRLGRNPEEGPTLREDHLLDEQTRQGWGETNGGLRRTRGGNMR